MTTHKKILNAPLQQAEDPADVDTSDSNPIERQQHLPNGTHPPQATQYPTLTSKPKPKTPPSELKPPTYATFGRA